MRSERRLVLASKYLACGLSLPFAHYVQNSLIDSLRKEVIDAREKHKKFAEGISNLQQVSRIYIMTVVTNLRLHRHARCGMVRSMLRQPQLLKERSRILR